MVIYASYLGMRPFKKLIVTRRQVNRYFWIQSIVLHFDCRNFIIVQLLLLKVVATSGLQVLNGLVVRMIFSVPLVQAHRGLFSGQNCR